MKLYLSPGACSLSCHIALHEGGIAHVIVKVNLRNHETEDGRDYYTVNPNGSVPALQIDSGMSRLGLAPGARLHRSADERGGGSLPRQSSSDPRLRPARTLMGGRAAPGAPW